MSSERESGRKPRAVLAALVCCGLAFTCAAVAGAIAWKLCSSHAALPPTPTA